MQQILEKLRRFDWSLMSIIKVAVAIIVLVITLVIVLGAFRFVTQSLFGGHGAYGGPGVVKQFAMEAMDSAGFATEEFTVSSMAKRSDGFVADNSLPALYEGGGSDAEEYERRSYNAHYETRGFTELCATVGDLKPREYVVFDYSSETDYYCDYTFRVEIEHEDEIVQFLKDLDPKDFNISIDTLERSIEYQDSELAMQQRRLESTQETLAQAEESFNTLIARATREGDTATLSEVINNKINTLERLNQQILNTQERIDRLTKNRGGNIEQIEYAHFSVSVVKVTFFDGEGLADEWKWRVQELVRDVNATLLALTVGLIAFALSALQFVVFAALTIIGLVFFAKILWVIIKRIWKAQPRTTQTQSPMSHE